MADLLLELFSEEIPARMQVRAGADLKRIVTEKLSATGLKPGEVRVFTTPRRLALVVTGLPLRQADVADEVKGPREGSPDAAIAGFLKNAGIADLSGAELRDTPKGKVWFAVKRRAGRPTPEVLAEILPEAILSLPWPKSMRWADKPMRWVRPLHRVLCLFDGDVVPLRVGHLTAGDITAGHRFLGPDPFTVTGADDYVAKLSIAFVRLSHEERRDFILAEARRLAGEQQLKLVEDAGLAEEVAGLVEWPVVLLGGFDAEFLSVPREVLSTAMRTHQKYFSLETAEGALAPRFVIVANMVTQDGGATVIGGNERVLRARLADARFFWDQDRKEKLAARVPALGQIVFHAKLGSIADKVARIEKLARVIAAKIGADAEHAGRAAHLCKADLVTGMVGEFPELQGVIGRYYARHDGEAPDVAEAIAEHYAPLGPSDRCPTALVSVAVALADKIDTLVGFFGVGEKPTGSKDPFALRRAALGVIRLVLENDLRLSLISIFEESLGRDWPGGRLHTSSKPRGWSRTVDTTALELLDFFADRVTVRLRDQGVRHDLVSAVFALGAEDDLVRLRARVDALGALLDSEDGRNLLVAYRRAANILRIEEKKDGVAYDDAVDATLLQQAEEKALWTAIASARPGAEAALAKEDFTGACRALAQLRSPVDSFFDKVTVNADDKNLRVNRLRLLSSIRGVLDRVAEFSKIEG